MNNLWFKWCDSSFKTNCHAKADLVSVAVWQRCFCEFTEDWETQIPMEERCMSETHMLLYHLCLSHLMHSFLTPPILRINNLIYFLVMLVVLWVEAYSWSLSDYHFYLISRGQFTCIYLQPWIARFILMNKFSMAMNIIVWCHTSHTVECSVCSVCSDICSCTYY